MRARLARVGARLRAVEIPHPPALLTSRRFWSTVKWVLIVGLCVVAFDSYRDQARVEARASKAEAIAVAEQKARRVEKVSTTNADWRACVRNVPMLTRVNAFVGGVNALVDVLIDNSERLTDTPPLDQRRTNLAALRRVKKEVSAVTFPRTTERECWTRRNSARVRLGLAPIPLPARLLHVAPER